MGGTFPNPSVKTLGPPLSCKQCPCHQSLHLAPRVGTHSCDVGAHLALSSREGHPGCHQVCTTPGKPWNYLLACPSAVKGESSKSSLG